MRDPVIESLNRHLLKEEMYDNAYDKAKDELEDELAGYEDEIRGKIIDAFGDGEMRSEVLKNLVVTIRLDG